MNTLNFQYIVIAALFIFALVYLYKLISKNFSSKKFKKGKTGCDKDCGCS